MFLVEAYPEHLIRVLILRSLLSPENLCHQLMQKEASGMKCVVLFFYKQLIFLLLPQKCLVYPGK